MPFRFQCFLCIPLLSLSSVRGQDGREQTVPKGDHSSHLVTKVPPGAILVKGAWSSASDPVTPVPEGGSVAKDVFSNQYFGITYALPPNWTEKHKGPPPSDSGRYVLAQLSPGDTSKGVPRGSILITAQDMFFTPLRVNNAVELINYMKDNLQADYKSEQPPAQNTIRGRSFAFFAYRSAAAQLHWYVLATEIRCHVVQIVLTSRDTRLLESLTLDMNRMKLPAEASPTGGAGGGAVPVCIKDYAHDENVIARVNPIFIEHDFNPVPVRIIIGKEGKVKHIHFLSAFPDQAKVITDALSQWRFKQYKKDGHSVEVETGLLFGRGNAR